MITLAISTIITNTITCTTTTTTSSVSPTSASAGAALSECSKRQLRFGWWLHEWLGHSRVESDGPEQAMENRSSSSSSSPTALQQQPQIRVIKPNRPQNGFVPGPTRGLIAATNLSQETSHQNTMPAVKILAKQPGKVIIASPNANSTQQKTTPTIVSNRNNVSVAINNSNNNNFQHKSPQVASKPANSFQILEKQLARMHIVPSIEQKEREQSLNCTKLLDGEFKMQESATLEKLLLPEPQTSGPTSGQSFCIVGAVGLDGVGKSSLLNAIAQKKVFKSHQAMMKDAKPSRDNPLTHVTNGVDLHITSERLFLLDTQPLLSASILDEFLRQSTNAPYGTPMSAYHHHHPNHLANGTTGSALSSVVGFDITEPENFAFIYSMQLLTFMFAICDHLILVLDSLSLDVYLLKLVATALMMVGDAVPKANLIIYLKPQQPINTSDCTSSKAPSATFAPPRSAAQTHMYDLLKNTVVAILGPNVNVDFITDERRLVTTVLKPPSRNLLLGNGGEQQQQRPVGFTTERDWLKSAQRFWDASIRKSSLFVDYARYLP